MTQQILIKAAEMFLTLGFKSVTMDDIANEMGISKKTIYQHFSNKNELVEATTIHLFETISSGIDDICALESNPIEELFTIKDFVLQHLKDERTSPIYQLNKYYPKIHKTLMGRQFEKMQSCVHENLQRGVEMGLFRTDLNLHLIARIYYVGMTSLKDVELFDPAQFHARLVHHTYLEYHLRGICTPAGIASMENIIQTFNHNSNQ